MYATDELLNQVTAALQEQSGALKQAGTRTDSLTDIARSNAAATEELTSLAQELLTTAQTVQGQVNRFRL